MFLTLVDEHGMTVISEPVSAGDVVRYGYIHSVEKVPVTDTFVVCGDGRLMLTNTTFGSSGAGLPTDSSYNLSWTGDGEYLIENINQSFDKAEFRVYAPSRCHFLISGKDYPVYRMVADGSAIVLSAERKPLISLLLNI